MTEETAADLGGDDPAARPRISLLPGHAWRAEAGHPWIFSNEVRMDAAARALPPGALVTLCRAGGSPLGVAMFNPHTLLAARLLDRDAGRAIGRRFFARRLERALALRERIFAAPHYRLVHAEATASPASSSTASARCSWPRRTPPASPGSSHRPRRARWAAAAGGDRTAQR